MREDNRFTQSWQSWKHAFFHIFRGPWSKDNQRVIREFKSTGDEKFPAHYELLQFKSCVVKARSPAALISNWSYASRTAVLKIWPCPLFEIRFLCSSLMTFLDYFLFIVTSLLFAYLWKLLFWGFVQFKYFYTKKKYRKYLGISLRK